MNVTQKLEKCVEMVEITDLQSGSISFYHLIAIKTECQDGLLQLK